MSTEKRIALPDFLTPLEFSKLYPDEEACRNHLFKIKYPDGYRCRKCKHKEFYQLNGKRKRVLQCQRCHKQESLTAMTIFHATRTPLIKWFWAFYYISQHKKGISSVQLGKNIGVSDMTAWLIMMKIRRSMQEDVIKYQIGGEDHVVQADEIDVGGKGSDKQKVLCLLEIKNEENGDIKVCRFRFSPLKDKSKSIIELNLVPMVAKGSEVKTDGNESYNFLANSTKLKWNKVAHWQEDHKHLHVKELNIIIGNFKNWYRGIFTHMEHKNVAYYLNEFAYRFNRRRTESNIFDRLLNRSIIRPQMVKYRDLINENEYFPMAT